MPPAHLEIEEELADRITSGGLDVGERLPSERELAKGFGVSRMTVRQALGSLQRRGLIERGAGRGTFVSRPKVEHDLRRVEGFTAQMERAGLHPRARLLDAVVVAAPLKVAVALELSEGELVARVRRVRSAGRTPMLLEDSWLPDARFPGITELGLHESLYALMTDCYGLEPVRAVERLEAAKATRAEASELGIAEGDPVMVVDRVAYAQDGTPLECARDRHRGDRARFVVDVAAARPAHA